MKKNIAVFTIMLIILSLFTYPAYAVSMSPTVELTISNSDNTYTVVAKLKGITISPLVDVMITFNYDNSVLKYIGHTNSVNLSKVADIPTKNENGKLSLGWTFYPKENAKPENLIVADANGEIQLGSISFSSLKASENTNISVNAISKLSTYDIDKDAFNFFNITPMTKSFPVSYTEPPAGGGGGGGGPAAVATPVADVPSGAVEKGTKVSLTTPTLDAKIYYTIDGKNPTNASTLYVAPIEIANDVVVKAIAVKTASTNSSVLTLTYTIKAQEVVVDTFTDLTNYGWAKDAINKLAKLGIIKGTAPNQFSPANNITRADFAVLLFRTFQVKGEITDNFNDVKTGDYYYEAVGILKSLGIAEGDGGNFRPHDSITRQDIIVLTHRTLLSLGYVKDAPDFEVLSQFSDKNEIATYATESVSIMVGRGIIQGNEGKIAPLNNATRAEAAVIFNRVYDLIPK